MTLSSLAENDPRLRTVCAELTRAQLRSKEQQVEIDALLDFVYSRANKAVPGAQRDRSRPGTVGLSASQVGVMKQISIVDLAIGRKGYHDMAVLVNPRIVWRSKTSVQHVEGCVNFTTIWGKTSRSATVKVAALDRSGHDMVLTLTGWAAVLLQHEIDHLNGRLFIDRLVNPTQADVVAPGEYQNYRKQKGEWPTKIDVSARLVLEKTML
jgi:peptide deformylase